MVHNELWIPYFIQTMIRIIFFLFLAIISLPVAATVSDCKDTNPLDVDSVFRCIVSYRVKPDGRNLFERNIERTSCRILSKKYKRALGASGVRYDRNDEASIRAVLPSCEIFSEIARRFTGNTPSWSSCLGRPESKEHLKNCLESTAKRYYGKPLGSFGGCTGLSKLYKRGISDASNFSGGKIEQDYLAALEQISCEDYLAALQEQEPIIAARWSSCMNYSPESKEAHLRACIGDDIRKLNSCQKVRALYEKKIKEAAGGTFPPGYILLDCALAESLIAEEKERVEKKRNAKLREDQRRREILQQHYIDRQTREIAASVPLKKESGIIAGLIVLVIIIAILRLIWRKIIIGKFFSWVLSLIRLLIGRWLGEQKEYEDDVQEKKPMSYQDAIELLGFEHGDFNKDELKKRVRLLVQRLHPDKGGSNFLTKQILMAEKIIKRRKGW